MKTPVHSVSISESGNELCLLIIAYSFNFSVNYRKITRTFVLIVIWKSFPYPVTQIMKFGFFTAISALVLDLGTNTMKRKFCVKSTCVLHDHHRIPFIIQYSARIRIIYLENRGSLFPSTFFSILQPRSRISFESTTNSRIVNGQDLLNVFS